MVFRPSAGRGRLGGGRRTGPRSVGADSVADGTGTLVRAAPAAWEQMVILAARRSWAPGDVGAVVLTDGSHKATNVVNVPGAMAFLCGIGTLKGAMPPNQTTRSSQRMSNEQ